MKTRLILICILLVSFILRAYSIQNNPPSLNWDEISHGYNAFSILKTGSDEWGTRLPFIFRAYGDYKLPLYIYLTAIFELFFGLNAFSVRLVSIISGVGLVLLSFLLAKEITKNDKYSLFAAFLTAISPWSLFLSRIAVEANLGAFLSAFGMYFLIKYLNVKKQAYLLFTSVLWGFSLHAYNSARAIIPIFLFLVFVIFIKKKILSKAFSSIIILSIFVIPIIIQFKNKSANARFDLVSLIDQGTINNIIEKRTNSNLPKLISRLIYNRPSYFIFYSTKNYFSNLSPKYLFLRGGSQYQFSFPDHELLYLVTLPFLLIGLIKVFYKSSLQNKLIGIWFFISFFPSAITRDSPHVLRSIFILPVPMILSSVGLKSFIETLKAKKLILRDYVIFWLVIVIALISFGRWWKDYFQIYPRGYSWSWQYGYKEAMSFVSTNYPNYNKIFITKRYGEPHEFLLFYLKWSPKSYQTDLRKIWDYHDNWYWVDSFDKFNFFNDWEVIGGAKCEVRGEKCLLITSPGNYPDGWDKIKTISFLDGKPVFDILEHK